MSPKFSTLGLGRARCIREVEGSLRTEGPSPWGWWDRHREAVVRCLSRIKLDINNRKATRKSLNVWKLSNTLFKNL